MIFSQYFFPDLKYNSIKDININLLAEKGIKFAILDIDNTLVPYTSPTPDENALYFLDELRNNGIGFCFVSNNNESRIKLFNEKIGAKIFPNAKKPLLYGISEAMKFFGADKENAVLIGDQVFTDILGGKRAKILTVLVNPIKEVDTAFFRFKRYFERKVLKDYEKMRKDDE